MRQIIVRLKDFSASNENPNIKKKHPTLKKKVAYYSTNEFLEKMPKDFCIVWVNQFIEITIGKKRKYIISYTSVLEYDCEHWQWGLKKYEIIENILVDNPSIKNDIAEYLDGN